MTLRQEKVNSLLKTLIANFSASNLKTVDALVSILKIETSKDLKQAKVTISILPEEKAEEIFIWFEKNKKQIKKHLSKNLKMKFLPDLKFEIDQAEKARRRIEEILKKDK